MREAVINGRTLHAEILHRLQASLQARPGAYSEPASATVHTTLHDVQGPTKSPDELLSELDRAMLVVYRRMPPEKQLALLSLFK